MSERCNCGAWDCPRCRPGLQRRVECADCGAERELYRMTECTRCDRPLCAACAIARADMCAECRMEGGLKPPQENKPPRT